MSHLGFEFFEEFELRVLRVEGTWLVASLATRSDSEMPTQEVFLDRSNSSGWAEVLERLVLAWAPQSRYALARSTEAVARCTELAAVQSELPKRLAEFFMREENWDLAFLESALDDARKEVFWERMVGQAMYKVLKESDEGRQARMLWQEIQKHLEIMLCTSYRFDPTFRTAMLSGWEVAVYANIKEEELPGWLDALRDLRMMLALVDLSVYRRLIQAITCSTASSFDASVPTPGTCG